MKMSLAITHITLNILNVEKWYHKMITLQGINISHLGKKNIIFKMPFLGDMLVPWRLNE